MLITGTILQVEPPDYTDNYGNHYQNITLQTQTGPVIGRKASKTPYGTHDINKPISWECEQKTNSRGPYNQFKTPQDPKYAQPQQGGYQPAQQGPQQPAQRQQANSQPNWEAISQGKVRHGVVCAYISAGVDPVIPTVDYWVEYIMTGHAPPPPGKEQDIQPGEAGW